MKFPFLVGCALLGSVALAQPTNYYPHQAGTTWKYSSGETQVLGQPTVVKGVKVVPLSHQVAGMTFSQDLLEHRNDGSVWLRGVKMGEKLTWYNPPLSVYPKGPLSVGQRWQSSTTGLQSISAVTGMEPVRNGFGNFNALVIRTDQQVGGKWSTQLSYFVPGVGVVRYRTADGSLIDLTK